MSRAVAKTLVPADVEALVHKLYTTTTSYAFKIKQLHAMSQVLNITLTPQHVTWDDEMWRMGTESGKQWDKRRDFFRPMEAEQITFDKETLLQCPICSKNMVLITKPSKNVAVTSQPQHTAYVKIQRVRNGWVESIDLRLNVSI